MYTFDLTAQRGNPLVQRREAAITTDEGQNLLRTFGSAGLALGLLGEEDLVDVGKDTTLGDGDVAEKLVQLLVVADGQLKVAGDDAGLLVVTSGVSSEFEDFSTEVFENGGEVDRCT